MALTVVSSYNQQSLAYTVLDTWTIIGLVGVDGDELINYTICFFSVPQRKRPTLYDPLPHVQTPSERRMTAIISHHGPQVYSNDSSTVI